MNSKVLVSMIARTATRGPLDRKDGAQLHHSQDEGLSKRQPCPPRRSGVGPRPVLPTIRLENGRGNNLELRAT